MCESASRHEEPTLPRARPPPWVVGWVEGSGAFRAHGANFVPISPPGAPRADA
jgi:hypothetical protein